MKISIVKTLILFFSLLFSKCNTPKKVYGKETIQFKDIEWKLLYGKINDSSYRFSDVSTQSFIIRFNEKKLRNFDGSFIIKGTSHDTSSVYYTSTPYTGFYKIKEYNNINLTWFSNIAWSFDFNKHSIIASLFNFNGKYEYNNDTLIFYKDEASNIKRDTLIMMKAL